MLSVALCLDIGIFWYGFPSKWLCKLFGLHGRYPNVAAVKQLRYFKSFCLFLFIKYLAVYHDTMYLFICGTYCGNLNLFLRTKHFLECVLSLHSSLSHSHHITMLSDVASTCLAKCTLRQKKEKCKTGKQNFLRKVGIFDGLKSHAFHFVVGIPHPVLLHTPLR